MSSEQEDGAAAPVNELLKKLTTFTEEKKLIVYNEMWDEKR